MVSLDLIYSYKVVFGLVNGTTNDLFTLTSLIHSTSTRVILTNYFLSTALTCTQRIIDTRRSLPDKKTE